jgi:hypothetical protein
MTIFTTQKQIPSIAAHQFLRQNVITYTGDITYIRLFYEFHAKN